MKEATIVKRGQTFLIDDTDPIAREETRQRKELNQILLEYLQKVRTTTRGEIKHKFMFDKFGKFHTKDYNAVVKEMINTGILKTGSGRKQINDDVKLTYKPC